MLAQYDDFKNVFGHLKNNCLLIKRRIEPTTTKDHFTKTDVSL